MRTFNKNASEFIIDAVVNCMIEDYSEQIIIMILNQFSEYQAHESTTMQTLHYVRNRYYR